ncbi:olfactory receptor 11A1-like [Brachionichthys hirsutus]|uniref:olfactory receptor 11A1-like n=1 Tax=Brachionichthys hirsutus TaxID=412623 RepID=UPI003604C925
MSSLEADGSVKTDLNGTLLFGSITALTVGYLRMTSALTVGYLRMTSALTVGYLRMTSALTVGYLRMTSALTVGYLRMTSALTVGDLRMTSALTVGDLRMTSALTVGDLRMTDAEVNVTYFTLGGYVDLQRYRYAYFTAVLAVYVVILCANFSIVSLIWTRPRLHAPMYTLIAALLLNSALYATAVYPKLLVDVLSERQTVSASACFFQLFLYYTCWGSEFVLLSAMAYDRYVSICRPLQYLSTMSRTTVGVFLLLAWFLPACQISVALVLNADSELCSLTIDGVFCVYSLYCVRSRALSVYGLFCLVATGLLPVFFILFTYARILLICYRGTPDQRTKAARTCLPHLLVIVSFTCLCFYDVIIARLESNFSKTARLIMTLQSVLYHPLFNPVIYGLKMKEISQHLKRLLCRDELL